MVALNENFAPENPAHGSKNRVGNFFGQEAISSRVNRLSGQQPRRENGCDYDETASGMFFYGFRYYDAQTGRWPNRDPMGERGGLNLYAMVGNDPVGQQDLLGLSVLTLAVYDDEVFDEELEAIGEALVDAYESTVATQSEGMREEIQVRSQFTNGSADAYIGSDFGAYLVEREPGQLWSLSQKNFLPGADPNVSPRWELIFGVEHAVLVVQSQTDCKYRLTGSIEGEIPSRADYLNGVYGRVPVMTVDFSGSHDEYEMIAYTHSHNVSPGSPFDHLLSGADRQLGINGGFSVHSIGSNGLTDSFYP